MATFPVTELSWGPLWNANAGTVPVDRLVNLSKRSLGTVAAQRGKQYELDQAQSGTFGASFADNDGALDPTNSAGPFFNHILPYQPMRLRMQYPPTANLLMPGQATGGDGYPTGPIPADLNVFSSVDSSGGSIVASGTAYQGSNVFQFACAAGKASGTTIAWTKANGVVPGATYTIQARMRNVTASTSQSVKARLTYYLPDGSNVNNYGSSTTLVGSTTAAWSLITYTFTMPANATGMQACLSVNGTSVACTLQVDAWQLELGSTASAFVVPSPWYPVFSGFVERWSTEWRDAGSFGVVNSTAVDAFALLSQRQIRSALVEEVYSRNPRFVYALDDPQGSTRFADSAGNNPSIAVQTSKYGAGSLAAGTSITAADPVNGIFAGGGTVTTVTNSNPGTNLVGGANFLSLGSAGIVGPDFNSAFTRMIAFRYTGPVPTSGNKAVIWSSFDSTRVSDWPGGGRLLIYIDDTGYAKFALSGLSSTPGVPATVYEEYFAGATGTAPACDGNWHLLMLGWDYASRNYFGSWDGQVLGYPELLDRALTPHNLISDNIGAWVDPQVGNGTTYNYSGDVAYACEWPFLFSTSDVSAVYSAWRNAFAGDSTDQRYARILKWAGYTGGTDIATGQTRSMGPVKGGADAMSLLQGVVDTENGSHWVAPSGAVTFRGRGVRYNATTPTYVFGERADLGEYAYEELTLDYDSTHLANVVTVTQDSSGQKFTAADSASQTAYFPRTMSRTINASDPAECKAAAGYLLSRYKDPAVRVTALKLHPGGNPALWPVCLALEIGTRVRVMRRAGAAPAIQLECFVEHIDWSFDDQNDAWMTLQLSPADQTPYGLFSAIHTTLSSAISIGAGSLVINAPAGGTSAPLLASMVSAGLQLVVDPGANQEIVTVTSAATTAPGWTTGGISISGTFTKTHAIGAAVYGVLPGGVTNPATWDPSAAFDSIAFSY